MPIHLRALSDEERATLQQLANSRTEPVRLVERAQIVWLASQGMRVAWIAKRLHFDGRTVQKWIARFNEGGLAALQDQPRSGRPWVYPPEQVGEVLATSLTDPRSLGLPFGSWTLDRLEAYLNEQKGILMKRSRIDELLIAEGLRWRTEESWFGEQAVADFAEATPPAPVPTRRLDPEFAQKRGRSSGFTRPRPQGV